MDYLGEEHLEGFVFSENGFAFVVAVVVVVAERVLLDLMFVMVVAVRCFDRFAVMMQAGKMVEGPA